MPAKRIPALTKAGAPRKRAPGAGRPSGGRSAVLPRITPGKKQAFAMVQQALRLERGRPVSLAEAVEASAAMACDVLAGMDPRRWIDPA